MYFHPRPRAPMPRHNPASAPPSGAPAHGRPGRRFKRRNARRDLAVHPPTTRSITLKSNQLHSSEPPRLCHVLNERTSQLPLRRDATNPPPGRAGFFAAAGWAFRPRRPGGAKLGAEMVWTPPRDASPVRGAPERRAPRNALLAPNTASNELHSPERQRAPKSVLSPRLVHPSPPFCRS